MNINREEKITVWTLLHGHNQVVKDFGIVSESGGGMVCAVRGDSRFCVFRIPHKKMLQYSNTLLFVGLIPQSGVSNRVIRLDQEVYPGFYSPAIKGAISTRKESAVLRVSNSAPFDMSMSIRMFSSCPDCSDERFVQGKDLVQIVYQSILAFPNGDERGVIVTFRYRSLEPQYRFVRSTSKELTIYSVSY